MSGGTFDYQQFHMETIATDIQYEIDNMGKEYEIFEGEKAIRTVHPIEVVQLMKNGVEAIKIAKVYADRIDRYLAGDDGAEGIIRRTKDALAGSEMKPWANAKTNPPAVEGDYLCIMLHGYVKMCHFDGKKWSDMWETSIKGVVKGWMPLPAGTVQD